MRNKAKQDKIVPGCDDVSYVILPNVKCCSCQKRARFSRKARSSTQKKSRSRSKEKSKHAQKKNKSCPKKAAKAARGEGKCWPFFGVNMFARVLPNCFGSFSVHKEWILPNRSQCNSLEISKINSYFLTPKQSVLTSTR